VNSPSIQIPITVLHDALQYGFSFVTKGNKEIAIGFRPDQFLAYALNAQVLHSRGADTTTVDLLSKAAALKQIPAKDLQRISKDRRKVIATVSRLSRDSDFRRKVTIAYDYKCAVTRMQLRLIDAAHILPVGVKGSNDEVYNGLCLSPTYHRGFDRSLVFLDEDLKMQINPGQERELIKLGLSGGISDFKKYLNARIHLPADRRQWPQTELIRQANKYRKIS
jgi:putative restriction endonuclease